MSPTHNVAFTKTAQILVWDYWHGTNLADPDLYAVFAPAFAVPCSGTILYVLTVRVRWIMVSFALQVNYLHELFREMNFHIIQSKNSIYYTGFKFSVIDKI